MGGIKTVFFDLDDTLFDHLYSASSALASIQGLLPRFSGRPFPELEREYSLLLEEIHLRVLSGEFGLDRARFIRMSRLMSGDGATLAEPEIEEVARLFRESYQRSRRLVEGAKELLSELRDRNIGVAIITNNQTKEQEEKLAFTGLDELVDFMITSEEIGRPKPDPHIFEVALERAGCAPEKAVMVGDSWASDVVGAKNAGIEAVWYNPRELPKPKPLPVVELRSLRPTEEAIRVLLGAANDAR